MNIAIADDRAEDLQQSREYLLSYISAWHPELLESLSIETFSSAEAFLEPFEPGGFDLLLLDIYMEEMTGMEAAEAVRLRDEKVPIIFLTTSSEHLMEGYRGFAAGYLLKPLAGHNGDFERVLDHVFKGLMSRERSVSVPLGGAGAEGAPAAAHVCRYQRRALNEGEPSRGAVIMQPYIGAGADRFMTADYLLALRLCNQPQKVLEIYRSYGEELPAYGLQTVGDVCLRQGKFRQAAQVYGKILQTEQPSICALSRRRSRPPEAWTRPKVQSFDWQKNKWLTGEEFQGQLKTLRQAGMKHLRYYPATFSHWGK